ncbi:MAG: hypothetical protein QW551_00835 [Desulfurococcaceae archaeon]
MGVDNRLLEICMFFSLISFIIAIALAILQRYVASFIALISGLIVLSFIGERSK